MIQNYNTHSTNKSILVYKNNFYTVYICPIDIIFKENLLIDSEKNNLKSKDQFLKSRILLRLLLKDNDLNYKAEITKDIKGKPSLKNMDNIHISISHSKTMIAVGFSKVSSIGVDIETLRDRKYLAKIASKVFNNKENKDLSLSISHDNYIKSFFKYWTKREALGKAYGIGLIFASNDHNYPENNHNIDWKITDSYALCISTLNL